MSEENKYVKLLEEVLNGVDAGEFSGANYLPEKYTYEHLLALFRLVPYLDGGATLYKQIYELTIRNAKRYIATKHKYGEKIKVAFLTISAAEWQADSLYRELASDERFECFVVVAPLVDRDRNSMLDTYLQTCKFLEGRGYCIKQGYDVENNRLIGWEEMGGIPDVLVHLTSWYESVSPQLRFTNLPLRSLNIYIPYSMHTGDNKDSSHVISCVYNKDIVNMCYRVYADSPRDLKGYQQHGLLQGGNVVYSGYIKMDFFLDEKEYSEEKIRSIWKIPQEVDVNKVKKVIIAPHHSLMGYGGLQFATFAQNYYFWPYLAEKYQTEVSFIFKPHPNLRIRAVEAKLFGSYEEYDAYIEKFASLPNVRVVQEADYLDIFATSDAMIMDSVSFLAEYMYADKPLLFLTKKGQAFSALGNQLISAYYAAEGKDYCRIEKFLCENILGEDDWLKEKRQEIYRQELDYLTSNGKTATQRILEDIEGLLE